MAPTLNAGLLDINNAAAPGTGLFTIAGGTIDNTSAGVIALFNNNLQTWTGDFTFTGTQALDLGTGAVTLGGTGTSRTVTVSASTLTVGGAISNGTTAVGITKAGNGVLVLNGSNTFTGPLVISAGEVRLGNAGALDATAPVSVTFSNNTSNKTLSLNGNSVTVAGLASSGGSGTITVQNANATAATLTISNAAASSYGGSIDGTGGGIPFAGGEWRGSPDSQWRHTELQ